MFEQLLKNAKDCLFPNRCLCGKLDEILCLDCMGSISINKKDLCPICGKLSEYGKTCNTCRSKSYLAGVMILGKHDGVLKDAIWKYKYESIKGLSVPLSSLLTQKYSQFLHSKGFLITNVPSSKSRVAWRGYNQSALLASRLAAKCGLEYKEILQKKEVIPQVGLSKKERVNNIRDTIYTKNPCGTLNNRRVLIVDDVYTTGSTLEESAKVVREAGAREVWGIVLSRD